MITGKTFIYNTPSDPTPRACLWVGLKPIHTRRFESLSAEIKESTGEQLDFAKNCLALGNFFCDEKTGVFKTFCISSIYDGALEQDVSDSAKEYYQKNYKPLIKAEWENIKKDSDLDKLAAISAFSRFHSSRF